MPSAALTLIPQTYAKLRCSVEAALLTGQREIEQAKIRTYHEAGRITAPRPWRNWRAI